MSVGIRAVAAYAHLIACQLGQQHDFKLSEMSAKPLGFTPGARRYQEEAGQDDSNKSTRCNLYGVVLITVLPVNESHVLGKFLQNFSRCSGA